MTGMALHTQDQDGLVQFRARPQVNLGPPLIDSGLLKANRYTIGNLEYAQVWGAAQHELSTPGGATPRSNVDGHALLELQLGLGQQSLDPGLSLRREWFICRDQAQRLEKRELLE